MFFISQVGEQDCAFACLKMMLANFHHDKNYLFLPCENKSYSFLDLANIASEYNTTLLGIKIGSAEELIHSNNFPFIATLNRKKGAKHSVLVLKVTRKYVIYFDPAIGKRKVAIEMFLEDWTNKALVMKEYTKTKCPKDFTDFVSKRDKISLPIIQIISGLSLIVGTYFLDKQSLFFIPIIFITIFLISELLFRYSLIGAMRRMDDNIYNFKFRDGVNYWQIFKDIEKYRVNALSTMPNFINSCLIVTFISIVFVMKSAYNAIYILLAFLLSIVEAFVYNPYFKDKSIEVEEKENEIMEVENDFQFKAKSNEIHSEAYQLALNKNVYFYIEIAVLLFTIVVTMILTKNINITYVVFFLCISLFVKNNVTKMLEYSLESEQTDYLRAKLINSLEDDVNIS